MLSPVDDRSSITYMPEHPPRAAGIGDEQEELYPRDAHTVGCSIRGLA